MRRVDERPQHPGDVAEREPRTAAIGEGPARFPLEVDHDPVARIGPEDLPEVVVAMGPQHEPGRACARKTPHEIAQVGDHALDRGVDEPDDLIIDRRGERGDRSAADRLRSYAGV